MNWRCVLVTWMIWASPGWAAVLVFDPSSQTVASGATVFVNLQVTGLGHNIAPSVGTFDIDVRFNPAIVSLAGTSLGTGLDILGLGSVQSVTPGIGVVNLFELSLDSIGDLNALQPGSFVLATLAFLAVADGFTEFDVTVAAFGDAGGEPLSVVVERGSLQVGDPAVVVPEPSAFTGVLLSALLLVGLRSLPRRRDLRYRRTGQAGLGIER